jgi:hypothetical protein
MQYTRICRWSADVQDCRSALASNVRRVAAVVNYLHFKEPIDPAIFARSEVDLVPQMCAIEGFRGFEVIQTSEHDAILVIRTDAIEVLVQIATEVGSPWMQENIVPLLDEPPQSHIGHTIASS